MFTRILIIIIIIVVGAGAAYGLETTLLKRTITVTPRKFQRFWKNPKAAEPIYNTPSWYPEISFDVLGPLASGDRIFVEFDRADGKPWTVIEMETRDLADDVWETIKPRYADSSETEKLAITDAGLFSFRIRRRPSGGNSDTTIFAGRFRVALLDLDQNIPENRGKKEFAVDYDWHLPLAYLWLNPVDDEEVPYLSAQVCLKALRGSETLGASLFFNGREIAGESSGNIAVSQVMTSAANEPHHRYSIVQFNFMKVRGFNRSSSASDYSSLFFLDKNRGPYEIRISRGGAPARTISFEVGSDGQIKDNQIARSAALGGTRMIFPARVFGALDGPFRTDAWKTDALFGNPPAGFKVE